MNPEATEQELFVLRLLEKTQGPVGAGTVREHLDSEGFSASEATVGRLLRDLDRRGLTSRVGFRGRVLTDLGSKRMAELSEAKKQEASAEKLLARIFAAGDTADLDLLEAREALESRIARRAAEKGADKNAGELLSALEEWKQSRHRGTGTTEAYKAFFETLGRLSGNGILQATDGILLGGNMGVFISSGMEEAVGKDLEAIEQAVAGKDPDAAEEALRNHIQNLARRRQKQKA
ncbi:MAG: FCD domain-containing protein [Thermovirgaceae bacterium]